MADSAMQPHQAARARAVDAWLQDMERSYRASPVGDLGKRFSSWRAGGDMCALIYILVEEVRGLRAELAALHTPRGHEASVDRAPNEAA